MRAPRSTIVTYCGSLLWLATDYGQVVKEMSMVGSADEMDWYLQLLRATLGLPRRAPQ